MLGDILEKSIFPGNKIVKIIAKQTQRKRNDFVNIPMQLSVFVV